jgi:Spore coat polysaccharide biosynthesis protein, predicted glycosyltransferase
MGGADPFGLTERCAHALKALDPVFRARFVIGPGFKDKDRLARSIVRLSPNFETVEGADSLATEFAACDVALAAFGVTAYELAASGVPAIYLGISEDHTVSASAFEQAGMGINLGTITAVTDKMITKAVWGLLNDGARRKSMRAAGLMTVDGLGCGRIAADLAAALAARRSLSQQAI